MEIKLSVKNLDKGIKNTEFLSAIRKLTLSPSSGMNTELNNFLLRKSNGNVIDAKAIVAYSYEELLGWALFSREDTECFSYKFNSKQGVLFQVYVKPEHRKLGIAKKLLYKARKLAGNRPLCVVPWDNESIAFFTKHKNLNLKSVSKFNEL